MPYFAYQFHAAVGNCAPVLGAAVPAAGHPAPRLVNLANSAGAALAPNLAGGIPAAGLGAVPALAAHVPYTWTALQNAAMRVGLFPPGVHPLYEVRWRHATLRAAVRTAPAAGGGRLTQTPILAALDAAEKRVLSYFTGITMAVYTAGVSGFTYPRHLSRHAAMYGGPGVAYTLNAAAPFGAAHLPDLIFVNMAQGTCQVWEGKGRGVGAAGGGFAVGGVGAGVNLVLANAINQTRKIASILIPGGALTVPNARVASVARINPGDGRWHLHVADPAQQRRPQEGDPVGKAKFYQEFYRPFLELVSGSDSIVRVGELRFRVTSVPGTSMRIGLDERIAELFGQGTGKRLDPEDTLTPSATPEDICVHIERFVDAGYPHPEDDSLYVSPEGILTEAEEEDLTQRPPWA